MTEPTDCLCGGGKDGTPRMDIVCPVHDADPTLLDSEIRQKLEMLEVPKMIFWVDKEMKVEKTKLTDKTIDEILALIATIGNEVIGQDAWGCYQHPQPNDGCSSESCEAGIHINEKLATQRSRLQELINGR